MKELIAGNLGNLISLAGVVISSLIAWFVSRSTASKEIEKLRLTWEREDVVSSDDEFAEMAAAVARFLRSDSPHNLAAASSRVAAIRSKESGRLGECLDSLYASLTNCERQAIEQALTAVIEEKRKTKRGGEASRAKHPH